MPSHVFLRAAIAAAAAIALDAAAAAAPTVWDGPTVTFVRPDGVDYTLPQNQDRITDAVWLTRINQGGGIFNFALESVYSPISPLDTEWSYGSAANAATLTFRPWQQWHGNNPPSTIGQDAVVHLVSEDIYIDIKFLSWSCCGRGGFSYERSTPPAPCDVDGDDVMGVTDLLALLGAWGAPGGPADLDHSGLVGIRDLMTLLAMWGPC